MLSFGMLAFCLVCILPGGLWAWLDLGLGCLRAGLASGLVDLDWIDIFSRFTYFCRITVNTAFLFTFYCALYVSLVFMLS